MYNRALPRIDPDVRGLSRVGQAELFQVAADGGTGGPRQGEIGVMGGLTYSSRISPRGHLERRRHPRYGFSVPVHLCVSSKGKGARPEVFAGESRDLSAGGMALEVTDLSHDLYGLLVGGQRRLLVFVPVPRPPGEVVFPGAAVWFGYGRRDDGSSLSAGLSFDVLKEKEQKLLAALLRQLNEMAMPAGRVAEENRSSQAASVCQSPVFPDERTNSQPPVGLAALPGWLNALVGLVLLALLCVILLLLIRG